MYGLEFKTRAMPCITELRSLFYPELSKIKVIPANIYELLTPVALARAAPRFLCVAKHPLSSSFAITQKTHLVPSLPLLFKSKRMVKRSFYGGAAYGLFATSSLLRKERSLHNAAGTNTPNSVVPLVKYANVDIAKSQIINENKGKSGVYR